jgi:hypothetical protein
MCLDMENGVIFVSAIVATPEPELIRQIAVCQLREHRDRAHQEQS